MDVCEGWSSFIGEVELVLDRNGPRAFATTRPSIVEAGKESRTGRTVECGLSPRSRSLMARALKSARSTSASCVSPTRTRWCRRSAPKARGVSGPAQGRSGMNCSSSEPRDESSSVWPPGYRAVNRLTSGLHGHFCGNSVRLLWILPGGVRLSSGILFSRARSCGKEKPLWRRCPRLPAGTTLFSGVISHPKLG
jgi:hypothetical protein